MTWQPCPRCGDGNEWAASFCSGCGYRLKVDVPKLELGGDPCPWCGRRRCVEHDDLDEVLLDAVRAPDLPTPPKAARLHRAYGRTSRAYLERTDDDRRGAA